MFKDLFDLIRFKVKELIASRLFSISIVFVAMLLILVVRLFNMQIIHGQDAQSTYVSQKTLRTISIPSTRGNIYDRNGKLLAYNKLCYSVTWKDTGDYNGYQKNLMIIDLLKILDKHNESIVTSLPIYIDENGQFLYNVSDNEVLRTLRDVYGKRSVQEVIDDEKCDENLSARGMFELLYERYGLGKKGSGQNAETYTVSDSDALRIINLRYLLSSNAYQRYKSVVVAKNVKEETMTEILEKASQMSGIDIEEDSVRTYEDGKYFAHIIGYTGTASADDLETLNENCAEGEEKYFSGDIVGKTGVEASMEDELQGQKGSRTMYLDSLGRILEVTDETKPVTGNDVYLSIDYNLQVGIYHLIEQHLAGIIIDKLDNSKVYNPAGTSASRRRLSIYEVYYQMINNNVLNMSSFAKDDAQEAEKRIYDKFVIGQKDACNLVKSELLSDNPTPYKDLGGDIDEKEENYTKIFFSYVYDVLIDGGYIRTDILDKDDPTYIAYKKDETISLKEFLTYALSKNWIDINKLELEGNYTSAEDTYKVLVDKIDEMLKNSVVFSKRVYKKLIYTQQISGCDICLALFEQGILKNDSSAIASLETQSGITSYDFIKSKIKTLEITPAQLAMDPCSAAVTIVDIYTGDVFACVSYPSYDNNKFSGGVSTAYYNSLVNDLSSPLYNTATQAQKAPGSVYKLVTTAAALEEGVTTTNEILVPEGIYTKQGLNLACSYYTTYGTPHQPLNIIGAIAQSCNYFFSEMGWRLSLIKNSQGEEAYNEPKGLELLDEYAKRLGLGSKSGIELQEKEPHISDAAPIPSAIGQGTNVFSNVQLARYLATLANKGTIYELSLLDKIVDINGNIISKPAPTVVGKSELKDNTWTTIQSGMRAVATDNSGTKKNITCKVEIAGKTGTAEENKLRPNHANFISYAPYDKPEIGVATTILYGYSASNSVKLSSDVYDLYYGYLTLDDILSRGASKASDNIIVD